MTLKIKQKCSGKHASHWPCLILWHLALICSTALNHTRLQHPNSTISYWILKPVRGLAYHKNNDTELTFLIRDLESKSYGIKQRQWYLNSMNNGRQCMIDWLVAFYFINIPLKFFIQIEMSPLEVKGCKIWALAQSLNGLWGIFIVPHLRSPLKNRPI